MSRPLRNVVFPITAKSASVAARPAPATKSAANAFFVPRMLFDGGSRGNPGRAGAGAHILMPLEMLGFGEHNSGALMRGFDERRDLYPQYREVWHDSAFLGERVTNNEAEYRGLIMGLEAAASQMHRTLDVYGDSQVVINQMKGLYKIKAPNLVPLYERARELCERFETITFTHVLREKNRRADALANAAFLLPSAAHATQMALRPPPAPSPVHYDDTDYE